MTVILKLTKNIYFNGSTALVGLGLLIVIEVLRSHTHTHTPQSIVLPWTRDRTVAKAST
jgi:hypothetical protein